MILGLTLAVTSQRGSSRPLSLRGELAALLNAAGGRSAIHDYRRATLQAGVFTSLDESGNGNHHTQAISWQRPGLTGEGADFNLPAANLQQTINGGVFTILLALRKNDASTDSWLLSNQSGTGLVRYLQSNTFMPPGLIVDVNGVPTASQGSVFTALHQAGTAVVTMQNVNLATATGLHIGRAAGSFSGMMREAIVLEHTTLGAELMPALALARQVLAT